MKPLPGALDPAPRWRAAIAVFLCLLLPISLAHADEEAARMLYDTGQVAFSAGRFSDAARSFDEAYRASHKPKLLWNVAQSWRRQYSITRDLADLRRAAAVFRNYEDLAQTAQDRRDARLARAEVDKALREAETAAAAGGQPALETSRRVVDSPRVKRLKLAGLATGATGVALVTAGVVFSLLARSAFNEVNTPSAGYVFNPGTVTRLGIFEPVGFALLGTGGAALVAGTVLYGLGLRQGRREPVTIVPAIGPSVAGFVMTGEF